MVSTILTTVIVALAVAGAVTAPVVVPTMQEKASGEEGSPNPANKISVAGSSIEHMTTSATGTRVVQLFDATIKTSTPRDLIIEVNAECALWTKVTVVDDDDSNTDPVDIEASEAEARVKVWVTIDGTTVPVSPDDVYDPGRVVFCDRVHGMTLRENEGDNDNETISNYLRTRASQSFAWIWLNAGHGEHSLQVFAELDAQNNMGEAEAEAAIGKRTLIVDPVNLANDEEI